MKKIIVFIIAAILGIGSGVGLAEAFQVTELADNSMLPAYSQGENILINNIAYMKETPKAGEVIGFYNNVFSDTGESKLTIKRIVGVPGDKVFITAGNVYVNDKVIEETYIYTRESSGEMAEITVPAGRYFVLGDNRGNSTDSRSEALGLVQETDILGKVIAKW